ncbi:ceramidase domain-containing protein [Yoonia sp. 2307UL14-13]|uniref:ceramidase domain-containing protein n=1 Tax=Yoonia sp. 2307UL14-13 TaxID=3126506 RepID=UPI0030ADBDCB
MDWFAQIDGYCERTDFTYWSEPLNAITNAAFIIAALIMWRRTAGLPTARVLCAILFSIGVGSYLFHTHATQWAALADVAPIGIFILTYLFLANRDIVGMPWWGALGITALFFPYAYVIVTFLNNIPFLNISSFYWTVPILLIVYATYLRGTVAVGFIIGAAILSLSITLRSLDEILCTQFPIGTHIFWHILNGIMLGWMIEVYRRHMLATRAAER